MFSGFFYEVLRQFSGFSDESCGLGGHGGWYFDDIADGDYYVDDNGDGDHYVNDNADGEHYVDENADGEHYVDDNADGLCSNLSLVCPRPVARRQKHN